jgi:hypothetical protein
MLCWTGQFDGRTAGEVLEKKIVYCIWGIRFGNCIGNRGWEILGIGGFM